MKRALLLAVLLAACSSGSKDAATTTSTTAWLDQWSDIPRGPDYKGHAIRIDEDNKVIYIESCALRDEVIGEGGLYGPPPGVPGASGYGSVCRS